MWGVSESNYGTLREALPEWKHHTVPYFPFWVLLNSIAPNQIRRFIQDAPGVIDLSNPD
jgi:hypothetical protein